MKKILTVLMTVWLVLLSSACAGQEEKTNDDKVNSPGSETKAIQISSQDGSGISTASAEISEDLDDSVSSKDEDVSVDRYDEASAVNESSDDEKSTVNDKVKDEKTESSEDHGYPAEDKSLAAPLLSCTDIKINSFRVNWEAVDDAQAYILEYTLSSKWTKSGTKTVETSSTEYTIDSLPCNKTYNVRVCSVTTKNGQRVRSPWSDTEKAVLKTFEIKNGVTYVDGMIIVNKTYSVPEDYGTDLTDETTKAFYTMASDAADKGIMLWINSGFRSYDVQSYTYDSFVYERGVKEADRASARPGHSEHQTGLAIDVNTTSDAFAYTEEAAWLRAHCAEYGFIIRYPEGKESITGYKYEPWHIRYVGKQKAAEITKSGLTVEEYYGLTSVYS